MKKSILSVVFMMAVTVLSFGQNNENKAVAAARQAVTQNCGSTGNTTYTITENFICNSIDGGFGNMNRTVTFYRTPNCPPNQFCIQIVEVVGSATVDCNNNVTEVSCGGLVTQ